MLPHPPPTHVPYAGARTLLPPTPTPVQMSVSLMAATLLQSFRFTPQQPCTALIPVGYDITLNFKPSGGLRMRVEPR